MHNATEKKKRGGENPKVSVRLNVRPLCSNWKPVKRHEFDGKKTKETRSPAQDQLDSSVWKTKIVRTDVINSIALSLDEERNQQEMVEEKKKEVGLVKRCECQNCELADQTPTVLEHSPKETKDDLYLEKKRALKEKKKRSKSRSKSSNNRRRRRQRRHTISAPRSFSTPPPAPPNSVISPESQQQWHKLYEEVHHPTKLIDFRKIAAVPGQIGMSELEPEDPASPPPTETEAANNHRSPNLPIMKPPAITPPSNMSDMIFKISPTSNKPPLVPQPPPQPQSNIIILPAPVDNSPIMPPVNQQEIVNTAPAGVSASSGHKSHSNSSLVYMVSSPIAPHPTENGVPSNSNVSMIRKMENIFYSSESNWWFLVALVMLTIFAYRSSMDQHTCYYD